MRWAWRRDALLALYRHPPNQDWFRVSGEGRGVTIAHSSQFVLLVRVDGAIKKTRSCIDLWCSAILSGVVNPSRGLRTDDNHRGACGCGCGLRVVLAQIAPVAISHHDAEFLAWSDGQNLLGSLRYSGNPARGNVKSSFHIMVGKPVY